MDHAKNKRKILFVSDLTFVHSIGGTEVATARLLNGLAEDGGFEVYLFSGKPDRGIRAIEPHPTIRIESFLFLPLPGDKGFNNFVVPNPIRMWKLIKKFSPDIVHVHTPSLFGYFAILMAKKLDIPLVYTSHMFSEHIIYEMNTKTRKLARKAVNNILASYMSLFDTIVYPSKIQQNLMVTQYRLENEGVVISNGFIPFWEDVSAEKPADWQGKIVFFTVSRVSREKNIHLIIDAFDLVYRKIDGTLLIIVGDWVVREELEKYARTKSSSEAIVFVGQKRGDKLAEYYKNGDVFVSASDRESEWLTTLEAISFGKPLILSDAPGNAARQFMDGNGSLFLSGSSGDLSEKMLEFIAKPELINIFGRKSMEIRESYRFESSLQNMKKVYESLIHKWDIWKKL